MALPFRVVEPVCSAMARHRLDCVAHLWMLGAVVAVDDHRRSPYAVVGVVRVNAHIHAHAHDAVEEVVDDNPSHSHTRDP